MCHFRKHIFPSLFLPLSISSTNTPTLRDFPQVPGVCRQRDPVERSVYTSARLVLSLGWIQAPRAPKAASRAPAAGSSQLRREIPALDCIHSPSSHFAAEHRSSGALNRRGQKHCSGASLSLSVGNNFCLESKSNSASWPTFSSKVSRVQNKWKGVVNNLSE